MTPEQLAGRAQSGCSASFGQLVERFHNRLLNFLVQRTNGSADAEDLVQETFIRAWKNIRQFNPRWKFSTWLYSIATRLAVDHHRARKPVQIAGDHDQPLRLHADPTRAIEMHEQHGNIWTAASKLLTDGQRTALWLRYAEDLSMKDIARAMGKSQISVRVMLFRARSILAKELGADEACEHEHHIDDVNVGSMRLEMCDA